MSEDCIVDLNWKNGTKGVLVSASSKRVPSQSHQLHLVLYVYVYICLQLSNKWTNEHGASYHQLMYMVACGQKTRIQKKYIYIYDIRHATTELG